MLKYSIFLLFALLLGVSGCTKPHPAIPAERNELVLRFIDSLRQKNADHAILQGQKIHELDPQNFFMRKLIEIQQSNIYLKEAQIALNAKNPEKALHILEEGLKKYPSNRELTRHTDIVRKVRHADVYFAAMRNAPNAAAMNSALIAARAGLSGVESKRLERVFASYEKKIRNAQQAGTQKSQAASEPQLKIRSFDDK